MSATIKSYTEIPNQGTLQSFGISRMEDIYKKRNGKADEPHRHDYYTILLLKKGKGTHFIDFKKYPLIGNQVFFIAPGQIHQVVEEEVSYGYSIVFSDDFLLKNNLPASFLKEINLFHDYESSPPIEVDNKLLTCLESYSEETLGFYNSSLKFRERAIIALMELLLIRCMNASGPDVQMATQVEGGKRLLQSFKDLVDEYFQEWHQTSAYAEALFITPDHLNKTVKSITGKTAKEHIQSRIVVAAKRLLFFSDKSTKEIAYELGFSEVANFSAFFKKCTGDSPSSFRGKK